MTNTTNHYTDLMTRLKNDSINADAEIGRLNEIIRIANKRVKEKSVISYADLKDLRQDKLFWIIAAATGWLVSLVFAIEVITR